MAGWGWEVGAALEGSRGWAAARRRVGALCHSGTHTPRLTFRISQTGSTKPCHPAVYRCISTVYVLPQSIDWTVWTVWTVYPWFPIQSFAFENLFRMQSESRIQSIQSIQPNDTRARGISLTLVRAGLLGRLAVLPIFYITYCVIGLRNSTCGTLAPQIRIL